MAMRCRQGDWMCPTCLEVVFARKSICFKCRQAKLSPLIMSCGDAQAVLLNGKEAIVGILRSKGVAVLNSRSNSFGSATSKSTIGSASGPYSANHKKFKDLTADEIVQLPTEDLKMYLTDSPVEGWRSDDPILHTSTIETAVRRLALSEALTKETAEALCASVGRQDKGSIKAVVLLKALKKRLVASMPPMGTASLAIDGSEGTRVLLQNLYKALDKEDLDVIDLAVDVYTEAVQSLAKRINGEDDGSGSGRFVCTDSISPSEFVQYVKEAGLFGSTSDIDVSAFQFLAENARLEETAMKLLNVLTQEKFNDGRFKGNFQHLVIIEVLKKLDKVHKKEVIALKLKLEADSERPGDSNVYTASGLTFLSGREVDSPSRMALDMRQVDLQNPVHVDKVQCALRTFVETTLQMEVARLDLHIPSLLNSQSPSRNRPQTPLEWILRASTYRASKESEILRKLHRVWMLWVPPRVRTRGGSSP